MIKKFFSVLLVVLNIFPFYLLNVYSKENFETSSPSVIVIEKNSGRILFEKNSKEVRYTASLMKIMNLAIIADKLKEGKINLIDKVKIKNDIPRMEGSNISLKSGDFISIEDLIKSISLISANDSCIALAEHLCFEEGKFVSKMNKLASKLHLENTIFKNCIGLDIDGNVSCAYDIAYLSKYFLENEEIIRYSSKWIDYIKDGTMQIVNTNKFLKTYPGTKGLKTGSSKVAGSCICLNVEKNNLDLIAVVLGCKDVKERNSEVNKILNYVFSQYIPQKAEIPKNLPKYLKIENSLKQKVEIKPIHTEYNLIVDKNKEKISSEIVLTENIQAPISRGKKVGEIIYRQDNKIILSLDIVTSENIEKKEFLPIIKILAKKFLKV